MKRFLYGTLALLTAAATLPLTLNAQRIERDGDTFTLRAEDEMADAGSATEQFNAAQEADRSGNARRAYSGYRKVERRFPSSDEAPRALFRMGQLREEAGDFSRAFDDYQKLIERYPNSPDFNAAIESQFKIATLYLEGERQRLLGVPTLPSMDRAREMFQKVIANAPYSRYAPLAQFSTGLTFQKQNLPTEAIREYQVVLDRYESSDSADDALYQIGAVWLEQARRGSNDTTAASRAIDAFDDFLLRFPDSEKAPQARENLASLQGRQTQDAMSIAQFYDRTRKYRAAAIYYSEVVKQEPNSEDGQIASARIDELRSLVGEADLEIPTGSPETAETARTSRRMQAKIDTAARPDYVGPPAPEIRPEVAPSRPAMRTSPSDLAPLPPVIEPELPNE